MLKFPPELIVHKGNVYSLLYMVGGLLMTVTAGSQCMDVVVRTAQNPTNLLRLSNTVIGLMGLRYQTQIAKSMAKRKLKQLYFTASFKNLLDMTRTTHDFKVLCRFLESSEQQTNLESTAANSISTRRRRTYYILICGVRSQPILILHAGNNSSELNTGNPSNHLQWLINFSSNGQPRGNVIFLVLGGQTGQISTKADTNDATNEPTSLTLGLSVLSAVLLWTFLPYIALCAVICVGWKVQQHMLQSQKSS